MISVQTYEEMTLIQLRDEAERRKMPFHHLTREELVRELVADDRLREHEAEVRERAQSS